MDQDLFFLINHEWTSPALDRFMATLSSFDLWIPFLCVLIGCVLVFGGFKARAFVLVACAVVGLAGGALDNGLKHAVNRPRPTQVKAVRVVDFQKLKPRFLALWKPLCITTSQPEAVLKPGRSFPSGHTVNNFAVAAVFAAFYRRRGWAYFLVAAGVAYSRIYTGAHWPRDVFVSVFIGIGTGLLGVAAAEALWRRLGSRVAPELYRRYPRLIKDYPTS